MFKILGLVMGTIVMFFPAVLIMIPNWQNLVLGPKDKITLSKGQKATVTAEEPLLITAWAGKPFNLKSERESVPGIGFAKDLFYFSRPLTGRHLILEGAEEVHIEVKNPDNFKFIIETSKFQKVATLILSVVWAFLIGWIMMALVVA